LVKKTSILSDENFAKYYESGLVSQKQLIINEKECSEIASIFQRFSLDAGRYSQYHDYDDTEALADTEVTIMMSIREYGPALFDEFEEMPQL